MKSKAALFWFVVSLVLGGLLAVQWREQRQQQLKMDELRLQVEKLAEESRGAAAQAQEFQKERATMQRELAAAQDQAARTSAAAARPTQQNQTSAAKVAASNPGTEKEGGGAGSYFANMLKDPEMRKAMREQQRMGLNMIYGSLFKQLQLSPEQEQKLKDILLDQQMENMSRAGDLMGAGGDRAEAMKKIAEEQKQRQEQIKELLGDEKHAQFEQYSQTMGERVWLEQFGKDVEISPEQKEQLLGIVLEEKKNAQINAGALVKDKDLQNVLGSPEMMERMIAQQEEINTRVLERAGNVLTAEQIRKLEPVLKSQLEMQRAGAKMARQMLANPQGGEAKQ
jgi:hypothetical protein